MYNKREKLSTITTKKHLIKQCKEINTESKTAYTSATTFQTEIKLLCLNIIKPDKAYNGQTNYACDTSHNVICYFLP